MPLLSDFGEARLGDVHDGLIQPDIYRAPEVILGMSWTSKVDIWNVGALVREK
jgi:serine/threonine protein kinase